jgi:hypothetical protein
MSDERDHPAGSEGSSGSFKTLDDSIEEHERALTMAELRAKLEREREAMAGGPGGPNSPELRRSARSRERDDELLDELPATDHHLGGFAGWRASRWQRWVVGAVLGAVVIIGIVVLIQNHREERQARLHPHPELEATITPGTPREMTYVDGKFRVMISREAPAVNLVHLPDRDITLARGAERASFKVEIRDGTTVALEVLTGEIVETLTRADAEPLLTE